MRSPDGSEAAASGSDAPGTTVDLRRRLCEAAEHRSRLEAERCALAEIRERLEVEERGLVRRVSELRTECEELAARSETNGLRVVEIETEIEAIRQETEVLARDCAAAERRVERLVHRAEALERDLRVQKGEVSAAKTTLRSAHASMARMDRKLGLVEGGEAHVLPEGLERDGEP